jgi:carbon monoxide dehydrogenase subunit G
MHLSGTRTLPAPRQVVWDTLQSPEALAACMPGCESLTPLGPDEYAARMSVRIASIGGSFEGRVALFNKEEPARYVMRVEGGGRPGRVTGEGTLSLESRGESTEVAYDGDVQVVGAIASVGQRLLGVTARTLIGRFFDCLERRLQAAAPAAGG